jgi:hypothetical protein
MKVGVLGSGDVAKSLAGGFVKHGHQVMLGTRDAGKIGEKPGNGHTKAQPQRRRVSGGPTAKVIPELHILPPMRGRTLPGRDCAIPAPQ